MDKVQKAKIKLDLARKSKAHDRVITNLKSRLSGSSSGYKTEAYGSVKQTIGSKDTRVIIPSLSQKEKQFNKRQSNKKVRQNTKVRLHKIDEISKYALARYQQHAADDLRNKSVDQGSSIAMKVAGMKPIVDTDKNRKKMSNRVIGIGRAANKLTQKTNEENLDEGPLSGIAKKIGAIVNHKSYQMARKELKDRMRGSAKSTRISNAFHVAKKYRNVDARTLANMSEAVHPMGVHYKEEPGKKVEGLPAYKVTKVGTKVKNHGGLKVGELVHDNHLDDLADIGHKLKLEK